MADDLLTTCLALFFLAVSVGVVASVGLMFCIFTELRRLREANRARLRVYGEIPTLNGD